MRYAVINGAGLVVNVVEAKTDWLPPNGLTAVQSDTAWISDTYDGNTFQRPPTQIIPPPVLTIDELYDLTVLNQKVLKALIMAINDGTFTVGGNRTAAQIKNFLKARM